MLLKNPRKSSWFFNYIAVTHSNLLRTNFLNESKDSLKMESWKECSFNIGFSNHIPWTRNCIKKFKEWRQNQWSLLGVQKVSPGCVQSTKKCNSRRYWFSPRVFHATLRGLETDYGSKKSVIEETHKANVCRDTRYSRNNLYNQVHICLG